MKDNVVLIGMPGSGKSTLGVLTAKQLGKYFLDTDIGLQNECGCVLSQIIQAEGLGKFREIEEQYLKNLSVKNCVIATGGSAVYYDSAMQNLKKIGAVVYLKTPFKEIERRVGDLKKRGVVINEGQTFLDLYNERVPLYEKYADITVEVCSMDVSDAAHKLCEILEKLKEN